MRAPLHGAIAAALLLLAGVPARADIAVLASGATLKVQTARRDGATMVLVLKDGGEVALPSDELRGLVPDEVVEEVRSAGRAGDLRALATAAAQRHGLDPALVLAVVGVESAFQPDAVSTKGAQGLMQLMPATAKDLGVRDALDPVQNLDGGARHLRALLERYDGDLGKALAAYNAGPTAVARAGGVAPYPETKRYVREVLRRAGRDGSDARR